MVPGDSRLLAVAALLLAAVGLYGGCRAILQVLIPSAGGIAAGRRATAQSVPITVVALVAMAAHQRTLTVVILLSSSIALLTLVLGLATMASHAPKLGDAPPAQEHAGGTRRMWTLILPVALLILIAGVRSELNWVAAAAFALVGIAILAAWRQTSSEDTRRGFTPQAKQITHAPFVNVLRVVQIILGGAVCGAGAWMMLAALTAVGETTERMGPGTFAAVVLCPLLILPVLGSVLAAVQQGTEVVTPVVGTVLINLCLSLPLCIAVSYAISFVAKVHITPGANPTEPMPTGALPFPPGVWRLENFLLVTLGLFLLAAGMRWLSLRSTEAKLLVAGYLAYLLLLMAA